MILSPKANTDGTRTTTEDIVTSDNVVANFDNNDDIESNINIHDVDNKEDIDDDDDGDDDDNDIDDDDDDDDDVDESLNLVPGIVDNDAVDILQDSGRNNQSINNITSLSSKDRLSSPRLELESQHKNSNNNDDKNKVRSMMVSRSNSIRR